MKQRLDIVLKLLMLLLSQQIPVKLSGLAPLLELSKILSHKEQLLTRMPHHKGISHLEIGKLIVIQARHLTYHGAFQMHHLIVGQHQNVILTVGVGHGKGHKIVRPVAEIGVQLHILQEVIHPSHIPLEGKAQSVIFRNVRYLGPCGGFLRNHHHARISSQQAGIKMLEKFNGL